MRQGVFRIMWVGRGNRKAYTWRTASLKQPHHTPRLQAVSTSPSPSRGCGLCIPYQTLTSCNPVYTINALPPPNHKTYTRHATVFACQQPLVFNPPEELARVQQVATPYGRGTLRSPIMLNGFVSKYGPWATVHIFHRSTSSTMTPFCTYFVSIGHLF